MDQEAVQAVLEAIRAPVVIDVDVEHKFALVPDGMKAIDLKGMLPAPSRIKQTVEMLSVPALLAYLNRFRTVESVIFANEPAAAYEAVLDYHPKAINLDTASERGKMDHVAAYRCPQSDQWKIWNGANGKMVNQVEFATFIETNLRDIAQPAAADFLQLCLQLQIHKSAEFQSDIRMDNGQTQFRYVENIKGTSNSKAGDLEIPQGFTLRLPVFVDGTTFPLEARFKYRMVEGKLSLGYDLIRPQETYLAAIKVVTAEIIKGIPDLPVYQGVRR
jgi:uncharacterized protein YfdQ (DUF2303 family)